jgi:hypothetical protein
LDQWEIFRILKWTYRYHIFKAFSGLCKGIYPQYLVKNMVRKPYLHIKGSWRSPIDWKKPPTRAFRNWWLEETNHFSYQFEVRRSRFLFFPMKFNKISEKWERRRLHFSDPFRPQEFPRFAKPKARLIWFKLPSLSTILWIICLCLHWYPILYMSSPLYRIFCAVPVKSC